MHVHAVPLDGAEVPYFSGVDIVDRLVETLHERLDDVDMVVLVFDTAVREHANAVVRRLGAHTRVITCPVQAGEARKRFALVEEVAERAVAQGATRRTVIAAMGGGMVGNVAGLAASLLFRGVRLVHLPTTPIAAFDSVLSVKQAVNLSAGKNLVGTYHRPVMIACDLRWLTSVPEGQILVGLAEMAKNVLAVTPGRTQDLHRALDLLPDRPTDALAELLDIGCSAKVPFLDADPRERREALVFEYGHTVGHALEFVSEGAMNHGAAVAWGMLVAAEVSQSLGRLDDEAVAVHRDVVGRLRLDAGLLKDLAGNRHRVEEVLRRDNKRGLLATDEATSPMVLLDDLGQPVTDGDGLPLVPVPTDLVLDSLDVVTARELAAVAAS